MPITSKTMQPGKFYRAVSPNGDDILGTYEMCPARAEVSGFFANADGSLGYDHEGGSEMFYDAMETVTKDGKTVFLCDNGDEWTSDQILFIELDEHGNDLEDETDADAETA